MALLSSTLTVILTRGLDLRMDQPCQTLHCVESEVVRINLGPSFNEREHQFVSSAALVPKKKKGGFKMWVRHGGGTSKQPHEAPLSLACG